MVHVRKSLLTGLVVSLLVLGFGIVPVSAAFPIGVIINGMKVSFPDTQPYLDKSNHTMVPIRTIAETLGATLKWQSNGNIKITYGSNIIIFKQHENKATVNGKTVKLDTPAVQHEGSTMVGLRFISEALGVMVKWDNEAHTVHITDAAFENSKPALDAWGRLIRSDKLPGNASDWAYVLEDIPNSAYTMGYRKMLSHEGERVPAAEAFKDSNLNREHLDQWVNRIKHYYDLVFSVDYRTMDSAHWWKSFEPYMNASSIDSVTRIQYGEWVQENGIRLEGWAEPEPSMTYMQDGQYVMRTKVRFRILESNTGYGTLLDSFQTSYEMKLKIGVWYSGYADITLSTNTSGDPWSHYGVDHHDNLFFTPVGNIQEEV